MIRTAKCLPLLAAIALAATACGGSGPPADEPVVTPTPAENPSAGADVPTASPAMGATPDTTSGTPTPAATGSVPCAQEIALTCGPGEADGCTIDVGGSKLTTHHACVKQSTAAGAPCTQEVALQCEEGYTDACLTTPPAAATHICVRKP
jgi:hypothetical protein